LNIASSQVRFIIRSQYNSFSKGVNNRQGSQMREKHWTFALVVLITFMGGLLRFLVYSDLWFIFGDDSRYAGLSQRLIEQNVYSLYAQDPFILHPPVHSILGALIHTITGLDFIYSNRLLSFTFGTMSIPVVFLLSLMFLKNRESILATFLFAISGFQIYLAQLSLTDNTFMFIGFLSLYWYIKGVSNKNHPQLIMAGLLGGFCALTRDLGIILLLLFFIYWILTTKSLHTWRMPVLASMMQGAIYSVWPAYRYLSYISHRYICAWEGFPVYTGNFNIISLVSPFSFPEISAAFVGLFAPYTYYLITLPRLTSLFLPWPLNSSIVLYGPFSGNEHLVPLYFFLLIPGVVGALKSRQYFILSWILIFFVPLSFLTNVDVRFVDFTLPAFSILYVYGLVTCKNVLKGALEKFKPEANRRIVEFFRHQNVFSYFIIVLTFSFIIFGLVQAKGTILTQPYEIQGADLAAEVEKLNGLTMVRLGYSQEVAYLTTKPIIGMPHTPTRIDDIIHHYDVNYIAWGRFISIYLISRE
jgi:4-amino-4-deoxy-L-arabinose transferase-like glycosyltransferase